MKTLISSIAVLIIYALLTAASEPMVITGKVTDDQGNPLSGVNIIVKKTSKGTFTDINGAYRITAMPEDKILVFSCVGFETREVSINGRTVINVKLYPVVIELKEKTAPVAEVYSKADRSASAVSYYSGQAVGGLNTSYDAWIPDFNTEGYSTIHENGF